MSLSGAEAVGRPLVCICIPCFNNEKTIEETLRSIVGQTYENIVIKVFDNASTDNTVSIVNDFIQCGRPIQLIASAVNIGAEGNFNLCIESAEGDYVAIFHADDVYDPDIIASEVAFLERNSSCCAVSADARLIDGEGRALREKFLPAELNSSTCFIFSQAELMRLVYKYGNFISCPSVLFRTAVLKQVVVQYRSELFSSSSDLDVWLRVAKAGGMGFINKKLMSYRISDASFSYTRVARRVTDADMFLVLRYYLEAPEFSQAFRAQLARDMGFLLMRDRASTNINRLILGESSFLPMFVWRNLRCALDSSFHRKAFILSLAVRVLISVPAARRLSAVLRYLRYRR